MVRYAYAGMKVKPKIGPNNGSVKMNPSSTMPNVVVNNRLLGQDFQKGILLVLMT